MCSCATPPVHHLSQLPRVVCKRRLRTKGPMRCTPQRDVPIAAAPVLLVGWLRLAHRVDTRVRSAAGGEHAGSPRSAEHQPPHEQPPHAGPGYKYKPIAELQTN